MALLVVLTPVAHGDLPLGSVAVEALARFGVTSVSLARDEHTVAVILDGWAFDPTRADAVVAALGMTPGMARVLQPVMQTAVMAATHEGGSVR